MPDLYENLFYIYDSIMTKKYSTILTERWELINPESIDYGILEKSKEIYTIKSDFKWNDLGSWKSLFNILSKDKDENYHQGEVISLKSNNNLVISPNRLTAIIGINNIAVINLEDTTLIVPHDKAEEVKNIVKMLKSLNNKKYL